MLKESFEDKFYMYNGASSLENLEKNVKYLGLPKSKAYFIEFLNQYYAVFYDTFTKEVVVGEDKVFLSENGRLEEKSLRDTKVPFEITSRNNKSITLTLAEELNLLDRNLKVYFYPNSNSKEIKEAPSQIKLSKYVVLLGLTFCSKFYDIQKAKLMEPYFNLTSELKSFLRRTEGAVAINPFTQVLRFKDGTMGEYRILSYCDPRSGQSKLSFALNEKNKFSTYQGREWMSLSRYKKLYPNSFIDFDKPDFREDKQTCKWCGKPLPEGRKSYCSDECRLEFTKATDIEKSGVLPYRILCRDKFICQTCLTDLALINQHGVKIPASRFMKKPDVNGKYHREAEVDHITPVEDGGEDSEENLRTLCHDCHKERHRNKTNLIRVDFSQRTILQ